jgi:hypothetical protein
MPLLQTVLDALKQIRAHHRRRLPFLAPALERRRPRIQMEDYAARHSIEHTLDRKAELRRLVPFRGDAAARYHQLLIFELTGLKELVTVLQSTSGGRELQDCLAENQAEIERLEIEVAWCAGYLRPATEPAAQ